MGKVVTQNNFLSYSHYATKETALAKVANKIVFFSVVKCGWLAASHLTQWINVQ